MEEEQAAKNQIQQLQRDIKEGTRKIQGLRQKRLETEEETSQCTLEVKRRVDLLKEIGGVTDLLLQFGELLQEEKYLKEQLEQPPSADRKLMNLKEQNNCLRSEERKLTAEIAEVKQRLGEAQSKAAQALISAPTNKPKRNQRKRK